MTVSESFEKFISTKRLAGLSEQTILDYRYMLVGFLEYVGLSTCLEDISLEQVNCYIMHLYSRDISRATISTYIRNLRIFLMYLYRNNLGLSFSPEEIKVPKSPKKRVHIYSDDEIILLFHTIKSYLPWLTARNKAMVALMLDSGLRQGEVCSLLVRDVDFSRGTLKVCGKGNKERYTLLGKISARFIREYMELCPYDLTKEVFVEDNGEPLSGNAVRLLMHRLAKKLPFELTSHKLRHNFATNWCLDKLEKGQQIDALTLQILMGHESIVTTQGYIHCALELMAVKSSISHLDRLADIL